MIRGRNGAMFSRLKHAFCATLVATFATLALMVRAWFGLSLGLPQLAYRAMPAPMLPAPSLFHCDVSCSKTRSLMCNNHVQTLWAEKGSLTRPAAQPRARRSVEIVRINAQDAREFSDPLVRDAIASVFIAADLPRRYVGGVGKLAHCHPAMLTVFLQALSDVCVDGALAIHGDHPPNTAASGQPRGESNCVVVHRGDDRLSFS